MHPLPDGALILAATPIGSSDDASQSLRTALASADVIAAEDTRRFLLLTKRLGIEPTARVVSYFEGNEASRTVELAAAVAAGQRVVLVTDAGMPSVSDPGYRLVVACIDAGLRVTAVPGPSAVLTALAVSGLPVDRFCFEGFLPRKAGERGRRLAALAGEERTMVFFEAPHRLEEFLRDGARELGPDRPAAVCRELTKPYEEVIRGPLAELAEWAGGGVRGEVTVVVAGAPPSTASADDALELVRRARAGGARLSEAVADVAKVTGANRKELYAAALADKESAK
ncbi:16S rRNA (cytidine(1402)-2'-O)-methyltransferase [Tessaracoccus sp. MC1679]|uniref:16S rRNA (cytidine(1402)-2'-O)-methyltransferase n=1 Tax=Tessaracoccus sp. MC1679 TaxID=2760313 RepID=UPI0016030476|nr:16S rRNA (cytidine(1402)-2'-O)-methyltransferase [Tessaracoccus sp. MC1679]MBB1514472.1 16S rRNA (cytidine(1402)-2'-O)-methyltransferase [Tessaracoccus sp. MC1679]